MARPVTLVSAVSLAAALSNPAPALVINVPADVATIQAAINGAGVGDEIVVAPGVWNERINFNGKAVTVRSQNVNNLLVTTLNGGAGGTVVTFNSGEGPASKLIGFSITNGFAINGAGIVVGPGCNPIIEKCLLVNGQAQNGGGIAISGNATVRHCIFSGNQALVGGGGAYIAAGANATLDGCRFNGNDAPVGSAVQILNAATLVNAEVFDNVNGTAVAIAGVSPVSLINCTIAGNAPGGVAQGAGATSMTTIANCIVRGNGATNISGRAAHYTIRYSDVGGGAPGVGNIDQIPQYVNAGAGDYRLQSGSPCIDAGDNASMPAAYPEDYSYYVRFADRAATVDTGSGTAPIVDMGAHEYPPTRRYVNDDATGYNHGLGWSSAYTDLQTALNESTLPGSDIEEIWVAAGSYKPDGGTGNRALSFQMRSGLEIVGGFAGNETLQSQKNPNVNLTILSGAIGATGTADNSYHVVQASNVNSNGKLIGFVIERGNADAALDLGGAAVRIDGGGPVIRECWLRRNLASYGAIVLFNNPTTDIIRCRFTDNTGTSGGGINAADGTTRVINCAFTGNHAGLGGAAYLSGSPTVDFINCAIVGNDATSHSGGVHVQTGSALAHNCILWANTAPNGSVQAQQGEGLTSLFSNVQGAVAPAGNDPLMVDADGPDNTYGTDDDNVRLRANSPCIDSADSASLPAFANTDLDGNGRFFDDYSIANTGAGATAYLDRGPYEWQSISCIGDILVNHAVDVSDLLSVIGQWGTCPVPCPPRCASDIAPSPAGDCAVNVSDLLEVIASWGPCP